MAETGPTSHRAGPPHKLAQLSAEPEWAVRLTGIALGGMVGLGFLVYSFLQIGRLLA